MAFAVADRRRWPLLVGLILVHLAVISHQVDGGGGVSLLQGLVLRALLPFQLAIKGTVSGASELRRSLARLRGAYDENLRLAEEVRRLELLVQERSRQSQDAAGLRELLDLKPVLPLETVAADVLSREGVPFYRTLSIDKGTEDGVALDAAVLSPRGVLGRVIWSGPRSARVQTLLDRDSGAGVLIERTRTTGVVSGQVALSDAGSPDLVMKYVLEQADVVAGDLVVTSGLDRIYPKGLVVGRVRSVGKGAGLFKDIRVEPSAQFDSLEHVLVVLGRASEDAAGASAR
jgi:rod shape-determining protein MreC